MIDLVWVLCNFGVSVEVERDSEFVVVYLIVFF